MSQFLSVLNIYNLYNQFLMEKLAQPARQQGASTGQLSLCARDASPNGQTAKKDRLIQKRHPSSLQQTSHSKFNMRTAANGEANFQSMSTIRNETCMAIKEQVDGSSQVQLDHDDQEVLSCRQSNHSDATLQANPIALKDQPLPHKLQQDLRAVRVVIRKISKTRERSEQPVLAQHSVELNISQPSVDDGRSASPLNEGPSPALVNYSQMEEMPHLQSPPSSRNSPEFQRPETLNFSGGQETQQTRILQIPRSQVRLITDTKQISPTAVSRDVRKLENAPRSREQLIKVQDSQEEHFKDDLQENFGRSLKQNSPELVNLSMMSPEVLDRKRYAINAQGSSLHGNESRYQPSFSVQPALSQEGLVIRTDIESSSGAPIVMGQTVRSHQMMQHESTVDNQNRFQMGKAQLVEISRNVAQHETSPKPLLRRPQHNEQLSCYVNTETPNLVEKRKQRFDALSHQVRKVTLPVTDLNYKSSDFTVKKTPVEVRAMLKERQNRSVIRPTADSKQDVLESSSSVVVANGVNRSQHSQGDTFSIGQDSSGIKQSYISGRSAIQAAAEFESDQTSISHVLNKVISAGYHRSKPSFKTPLQRQSNSSVVANHGQQASPPPGWRGDSYPAYLKYQNSLGSDSIERQRLKPLVTNTQGGSSASAHGTHLNNPKDRSFSIQPQYSRMPGTRLDDISRGSSQEQIHNGSQIVQNVYQTLQPRDGQVTSQRRPRNATIEPPADGPYKQFGGKRGLRSPFEGKRTLRQPAEDGSSGGAAEREANQLRVPGILIDSINSQKLRSKSTFRGNIAGLNNKLTSLQTMAHTSDQQYSSAGRTTGLASIQYSTGKPLHQKTPLDRMTMLEEIEKSKIEEIKQRTLRNIDKYSRQAASSGQQMASGAQARFQPAGGVAPPKYVPAIVGAGGDRQKANNPFVRSASKGTKRAQLKSRCGAPSGASVKESIASKHSYEPAGSHAGNQSVCSGNDHVPDRDGTPLQSSGQVAKRDSFLMMQAPFRQPQMSEVNSPKLKDRQSGTCSRIGTAANQMNHDSHEFSSAKSTLNGASSLGVQVPLGSSMEDGQIKRKLNRNTINLAKLSLVLKNKSSMNVSHGVSFEQPQPNATDSVERKPPHALSIFQQEEINSIANILNETLSKLKKPNTHVLTPLEQPAIKSSAEQPEKPAAATRRTSGRNVSLLSIVGGLGQSALGPVSHHGTADLALGNATAEKSSPTAQADATADEGTNTIPEEEVELDLDDLTQEDKFYLIQQIEAVQKNIRYYSGNQETYVFQDFEETPASQGTEGKSRYHQSDPARQDGLAETSVKDQGAPPGSEQRESPKFFKERKSISRGAKLSQVTRKGLNSPPSDRQQRSSLNVNNAISFVTSALGLLAQESLEIIEDADEVEEDELDNINLCDQSPTVHKQPPPIMDDQFSPIQASTVEEPGSPSQPPFRLIQRSKRRNLNEGQRQILSKGDLKRYKGQEEEEKDSSHGTGERHTGTALPPDDGPEEVSVLLHRGSRIVKDFDILRFSKASSVDQNFVAEQDPDSRLQVYLKDKNSRMRDKYNKTGSGTDGVNQRDSVGDRSPMAVRRSPSSKLQQHSTLNIRKLTNSLFDEGMIAEVRNTVIKEDDLERDERD